MHLVVEWLLLAGSVGRSILLRGVDAVVGEPVELLRARPRPRVTLPAGTRSQGGGTRARAVAAAGLARHLQPAAPARRLLLDGAAALLLQTRPAPARRLQAPADGARAAALAVAAAQRLPQGSAAGRILAQPAAPRGLALAATPMQTEGATP